MVDRRRPGVARRCHAVRIEAGFRPGVTAGTVGSMPEVTLREITRETVWPIMTIEVAENQGHLVAPNSMSIAEAYFEPKAWFRAIYAEVDLPTSGHIVQTIWRRT